MGIGSLIKGAPTRRTGIERRVARFSVAAVCVAALACGCGSGAVNGPGEKGGKPSQGTKASGQGNNAAEQGGHPYTWGLPEGNTETDANDGLVYDFLQQGKCTDAQNQLDTTRANGGEGLFHSVNLLQAAIDLCKGDVAGARAQLAAYHWAGSPTWFICELYRTSASVIHQRDKTSFATCPPVVPKSPGRSVEPSGPSVEPSTPGPSVEPSQPGQSPEQSTGPNG
jgi:hypothetical protein